MNPSMFRLRPFSFSGHARRFTISGSAGRKAGKLILRYNLRGPLPMLRLPPASPAPQRREALWQQTCFECFLGTNRSNAYWEFNFSPSGDWNIYRFDDYRQGMRPESRFSALTFEVRASETGMALTVGIDLESIAMGGRRLKLGFSAILAGIDGESSYWALAHYGPTPDFHHNGGFCLVL